MYGAHLASISTPEEQRFINGGLGALSPAVTHTHSSINSLMSVCVHELPPHSLTRVLTTWPTSFC